MFNRTTDGSNDNEAVKIVNALKPFWEKWTTEWGRNCVRSKKMTVSTAPSVYTGLIGVTDAFSDTECMIPYKGDVALAKVGDTVWVRWMYDNQQTMYAELMGGIFKEGYATDSTPYYFRRSGGGTLGTVNRETDKLIGGTVAWNNIISSTYTTKTYEGITTAGSNGTFTITNNSRTSKYVSGSTQNKVTSAITGLIKSGHKYIVYGESTSDLTGVCVALGSGTVGIPINSIFVPSSSANYLTLRVTKDYDFVTNHPVGDVCTFTMNVTDLTQAFGLTIADYIYALESNTAGAGIAWLKSYGFLSKDYYQYHAATLESVNASAHVMRDASDNIIGNYALDADLQLRGILKLDANNKLYYDGDEYASDGTVTRKYGIRAFESGDATDGSTMITDGTNTVYELATPTTETAEPYTNPQVVDASGTEQYVDASYTAGTRDFEMPVGHSTEYYNLQSYEQQFYDTPKTDGTYRLVCKVINGNASLEWIRDDVAVVQDQTTNGLFIY